MNSQGKIIITKKVLPPLSPHLIKNKTGDGNEMKQDIPNTSKNIAKIYKQNPSTKAIAKPITKVISKPIVRPTPKNLPKSSTQALKKPTIPLSKPPPGTIKKQISKIGVKNPVSKPLAKPLKNPIEKPVSKLITKVVRKPIIKQQKATTESTSTPIENINKSSSTKNVLSPIPQVKKQEVIPKIKQTKVNITEPSKQPKKEESKDEIQKEPQDQKIIT